MTAGYGCGDVTIDLAPSSSCPVYLRRDITQTLPFKTDSVVVFESCVLEYVDDADAAVAELKRISGDHVFSVRVEPWTLTSRLYPGTKRVMTASEKERLGL